MQNELRRYNIVSKYVGQKIEYEFEADDNGQVVLADGAVTLVRELREEIERLTVALAGISSIAIGCGLDQAKKCVEKREWAFVPTMKDVLELRLQHDVLRAEVERLSKPVSDDAYHFEDHEIIAAIKGSNYLVGRVRAMLMGHTSGEKWSLYRAIANLIASRKEQP